MGLYSFTLLEESRWVYHFFEARICLKKVIGASFPANAENELKFARDVSFTNTVEHPSGLRISMPPDEPLYSQGDVPQSLMDELETVSEGIFGKEVDKTELKYP